jgi:hypothetical protein
MKIANEIMMKKPTSSNIGPDLLTVPKTDQTENLNYIPFSYEEPPTQMRGRDWFKKYHDDKLRARADKLTASEIQTIIFNIIDSLLDRAERKESLTVILGLVLTVEPALQALHYVARNHRSDAARYYVSVLKRAIDRLNHNDERNNKAVADIAKSQIFWPINYSPNKISFDKHILELKTRLNIGDDYFLKLKGRGSKDQTKSFDFDKPINRMVWRMIETLVANRLLLQVPEVFGKSIPAWVQNCRKLKPLTKSTITEWANVGWEAICQAYGDHPENHPQLRTIGKDRERAARSEKAKNNAIRGEIRQELKMALNKLVK